MSRLHENYTVLTEEDSKPNLDDCRSSDNEFESDDTLGINDNTDGRSESDILVLERNPWDELPYSSQYFELLNIRKRLPVWQAKDDFILSLDESQIVLVTGKAGSGKSTQIPQWCAHYAKEAGFKFGSIVCAQPHAIVAASLAIHVSREMDLTGIGNEVGYKIPFADVTSEETILKFCTYKDLLGEIANDVLINRYGIVIVDEVQERLVAGDLLLSFLKIVANHRKALKIVVISLPHEMPKLEEYFDGVPIIDLEFMEQNLRTDVGRQIPPLSSDAFAVHGANLHFKKTNNLHCDFVSDVVVTLLKCHSDQTTEGDIMVFLPGEKEILEVSERVAREAAIIVLRGDAEDLSIIPLHANLNVGEQQAVHEKSSTSMTRSVGGRKVFLCDSIAESSFSVNNIAVVIDSGRRLQNMYNCRTRCKSNILCYISKQSSDIRSHRCKVDGHVYRLYTKQDYEKFDECMLPDVVRSELSTDVLLMKRLLRQLNENFSSCQILDPPAPDAYMQALEDLDYQGALDENGDLSDLGAVMSEFPVSLPLAKSLIASCGEQCTEEMIAIAAMLVAPSAFLLSDGNSLMTASNAKNLYHPTSDHLTLLNIFEAFMSNGQSAQWCKENDFKFHSLCMASKIRTVLASVMNQLELPMSQKVKNQSILKRSIEKALLAGFFLQIAKDVDGCGNYLILRDRYVSRLSKSSTVRRYPEWLIYHDFVLSETSELQIATAVTKEMIAEISPNSFLINLPSGEFKDTLLKEMRSRNFLNQLAIQKNCSNVHSVRSGSGSSAADMEANQFDYQSGSTNPTGEVGQALFGDILSNDVNTKDHVQKIGRVISNSEASPESFSDLFNATTAQLSHAYREASDYMRTYSTGKEENKESNTCMVQ